MTVDQTISTSTSTGASTSDETLDFQVQMKSPDFIEFQTEQEQEPPLTIKKQKNSKKMSDPRAIASHKLDLLQLQIALAINLFIFALNKYAPNFHNKFYTLQYKSLTDDTYDVGRDDAYAVILVMVNFTLIRSLTMVYILTPLAKMFKIHSFKALQRFKEQGWYLIYYSASWSFGFYLYIHSSYFLSLDKVYEGWPHDQMSWLSKSYYLMQIGCWLEQITVLHVEEKRKDYLQMFSHHIITCLLVIGSYRYYFTHIGHVILIIMDVVDVFLSLAKMLKYCGFQTICDIMFIVFMVSWIILRHGVYNYIYWHLMVRGRYLMNGDCANYVEGVTKMCFTNRELDFFLVLLGLLQLLTLTWMYLILKVAIKVIRGKSADDVRSDEEDTDIEESIEGEKKIG